MHQKAKLLEFRRYLKIIHDGPRFESGAKRCEKGEKLIISLPGGDWWRVNIKEVHVFICAVVGGELVG